MRVDAAICAAHIDDCRERTWGTDAHGHRFVCCAHGADPEACPYACSGCGGEPGPDAAPCGECLADAADAALDARRGK